MTSLDTSIILAVYFDKSNNKTEVNVRTYYDYLNKKNKLAISEFIYQRLYSRYLKPFQYNNYTFKTEYRNGFSIMANCCLLIETLESFKNGWEDTQNLSETAFTQFFSSDPQFESLRTYEGSFYKNVRCGILHQGETTSGWKISRIYATLFDPLTNTIDSLTFQRCLNRALEKYSKDLTSSDWDSVLWRRCRKKMKHIIDNCRN